MRLFRTAPAGRSRRPRWELLVKTTIYGHGTGRSDPLLTRYRLLQTPAFGIYVHQHHRADADRDVHDHPWWFATLVLRGGYREWWREQARGSAIQTRDWSAGSLHRMRRCSAHRTTMVQPNTWTLLLVGPRRQDWGFWLHDTTRLATGEEFSRGYALVRIPPHFVPWREYVARRAHPGGPRPTARLDNLDPFDL